MDSLKHLRKFSRDLPRVLRTPAELRRDCDVIAGAVSAVASSASTTRSDAELPLVLDPDECLFQYGMCLRAMRQEWVARGEPRRPDRDCGGTFFRLWWSSLLFGVAAGSIDEVRAVIGPLIREISVMPWLPQPGTDLPVTHVSLVGLAVWGAALIYAAASSDDVTYHQIARLCVGNHNPSERDISQSCVADFSRDLAETVFLRASPAAISALSPGAKAGLPMATVDLLLSEGHDVRSTAQDHEQKVCAAVLEFLSRMASLLALTLVDGYRDVLRPHCKPALPPNTCWTPG